jgi:integrase
MKAIIDYMTERYPDGVANFVEFKFFSGLRPSETTALRWSDVDQERDRVHVHRAIVRRLEKNTTKTSTARHVLLNSRARAALLRQRALTQWAGDFVFLDPRYGKPWTEGRAFRCSYWAPTLKALGAALPAALQHSPQLREDDADFRHDAGVLRGPTGALLRHAAAVRAPCARPCRGMGQQHRRRYSGGTTRP